MLQAFQEERALGACWRAPGPSGDHQGCSGWAARTFVCGRRVWKVCEGPGGHRLEATTAPVTTAADCFIWITARRIYGGGGAHNTAATLELRSVVAAKLARHSPYRN